MFAVCRKRFFSKSCSLLTLSFIIMMCVCVLPRGRSFLIVLDLRLASWPLSNWATFFHSIQHSRSRTRSPCRKVWPSQTLCLLLMTDMMALSSPTRLNTSSLQTLSDQEMLETFLQNISQLCGFNVPDSTPYRIENTPDDSLYNSLVQAKAEGSCQQFFSLSNRVLCRRAILGDNDIACNF